MFGIDLKTLIEIIGYVGVFLFVFAESGLFFGFFLPGDSLLFTAGLLASEGYFSLAFLIALSFVAAVAGDSVGYYFGKKTGKYIFVKEESLFFSKKNLKKSTDFYAKYGPKTIILARFIPVVRTFAPILAGTSGMEYKKFLSFNLIGGFLWTLAMPLLGYFLGNSVEDIDKYLLPIVFGIIIVSFIPVFWQLYKMRFAKGGKAQADAGEDMA